MWKRTAACTILHNVQQLVEYSCSPCTQDGSRASSLDQLDHSRASCVSSSRLDVLQDAAVTPVAVGVAFRGLLEQRVHKVLVVHESQGLAPGVQRAVLAQRDHLVHVLADHLRPRLRRAHATVADDLRRQRPEHRLALVRRPPELLHAVAMADHGHGSRLGNLQSGRVSPHRVGAGDTLAERPLPTACRPNLPTSKPQTSKPLPSRRCFALSPLLEPVPVCRNATASRTAANPGKFCRREGAYPRRSSDRRRWQNECIPHNGEECPHEARKSHHAHCNEFSILAANENLCSKRSCGALAAKKFTRLRFGALVS
eukprot:scaffold347_cov239-Pinguiococcus_pyrenoidosus.AAC.29